MNYLTILQFLLLPIPVINHYFTNTPISHSSGLFYSKLGVARITKAELSLLAHRSINYLKEARIVLKSNFQQTQNLCIAALKASSKHNMTNLKCGQIIQILELELENIDKKHEILFNLLGQKLSKRKKRGVINGASYVFNWIFGTPDADDAQYYMNSINMLLNDNKQTHNMLKSQVQIISSAVRNFNNSFRLLRINENLLNENIKLINMFVGDTNLHLHQLKIESLISQQSTFLSSLTSKVLNEYNENIEIISLGIHNIVSPLIITPNDLCKELQEYRGEFELVLDPNSKNMHIFYKLMKLQIISVNEMIIYALKLPLIKQTAFDLFDLIPFPVQHKNTSMFSYIEPRSRYLLLSQSKTIYSTLQVLSDCEEYLERRYLCTNVHDSKILEKATCEIQLLAPSTTQVPKDCIIRTMRTDGEIWKYIGHNSWIYTLQEPTTVTILCGGDTDHLEDTIAHKSGIFQIQNQCKAYTNQYLLEPTKHLEKNISYHVPAISITDNDCCIPLPEFQLTNPALLKPIRLANADLSDLKYADKKLSEIERILADRMKQPFTITHTKWYVVVLCVLGGLVVFIVGANLCRWLGCRRIIQRIFCLARRSNNEESLPAIRNYVNCTFDSDVRREYREASRDVIIYRTKGEKIKMTDESTYLDAGIAEDENYYPPSQATPSYSQSIKHRRSTTPL